MNLRLCLQALLLLWLSLTAVCGVPLMLPPDGKGLEEGNMRYLVQPRASRTGPGPWQGGRRKFRRQRPVSPIRAPCLSESGLKGSPRTRLVLFSLLHRFVPFSGTFSSIWLMSCTCYSCQWSWLFSPTKFL